MMSSVTGDMVADPGERPMLSKAAIVGLTNRWRWKYAQSSHSRECHCPGYVRTPMAESIARQSQRRSGIGINGNGKSHSATPSYTIRWK